MPLIDNDRRLDQVRREIALRDLANACLAKAMKFHSLQDDISEADTVELHLLIGTASQINVELPRASAVAVLRVIEGALQHEANTYLDRADSIARLAPPDRE